MKLNKVFIVRVFIGFLFIFSGIVKLMPILAFEMQLVGRGISNWWAVMILSRLVIGVEIFLGLAFFQKSNLKRIFIPAAALLLIIYSIDLVRTIVVNGWAGNCGCFGQVIVMTPLEALIKNIFLFAGLYYIYSKTVQEKKGNIILQSAVLVIVLIPLFVLTPMREFTVTGVNEPAVGPAKSFLVKGTLKTEEQKEREKKKKSQDTIDSKLLVGALAKINNFNSISDVDFSKGEKIVAFLSLECSSCYKAAEVLSIVRRKIKLPEVYYYFLGNKGEVDSFFNGTKTNYPYKILDDMTFFSFIIKYPPRILLLKNGKVFGDWNEETFKPKTLLTSLKKVAKVDE